MISKLIVSLIIFYQQFLSFDRGLLSIFAPGGACKFSPTCSEYTKQMILKYGVFKGIRLGLIRISQCW